MTIKIPGEVIPYIYLIGIDLKYDLESGFGKPNNTPHYELPGIRPRIAQLIIDSVHFANQTCQRVLPYIGLIDIGLK